MEKQILVKFASRSRPEKCLAGVRNILETAASPDSLIIAITADLDDDSMNNDEFRNQLAPYIAAGHVHITFGRSESKVHAINRDMPELSQCYPWLVLVNFSDDMRWIQAGWDQEIMRRFAELYPDFDGNIYYNDGYQGQNISTMSIIGHAYFSRFNYIYHPSYKSLFCDNEYTELAYHLNKITYLDEQWFVHDHPCFTNEPYDDLLKHTESFWGEDESTYATRRSAGFP